MSLQVWLPLNGNLDNQGLVNAPTTNNGATINNNGKIGKCYSFGGNNYITLPTSILDNFSNEISVSVWINISAWNSSYDSIIKLYAGNNAWNNSIFGMGRNGTTHKLYFTIANQSSSTQANCSLTQDANLDTWYHMVCVYDSNKKMKIYLNGELKVTYTTTIVPKFSAVTSVGIGGSPLASYGLKGKLNDLRIYNHALSLKEIKEISKGLVLHYPLNQNLGLGLNLIKNGFGQLGTENWQTVANRSTTEIPSGHSQIKASFFNNQTKQYIPINKYTTYKLQLYIKANPGSTSNMYPSIIPYDVDKKHISYYHCRIGFDLDTLTTLAQPLNPGDTKIYVTDLSNWNANSGHRYNYAAIFNYQDSTGYVYKAGEYTRNTPTFGSSTKAKTNLDKTNNIITLNSAYTGPFAPAGTSVCAATTGGNYQYPFGALKPNNYQDWTFISKKFTPSLREYLQAAKYIRFLTGWSHQYEAGIRITDLSTLDTIMSDDSGYLQNGTLNGTFESSTDTPRYSASQKFIGTNYISLTSPCEEVKTISLWVKWDSIPSERSVVFVDYKSKLGFGLALKGIVCSTSGPGSSYMFSKVNIVANTWYHFVIINPGAVTSVDRKLYINGVEQTHTSDASSWTCTIDQLQLGKRSTTSDGFQGLISDFRMYSTVLNEEDILELYHTSAIADRNNNFYIYKYNETNTTPYNITKQNIVNTTTLLEEDQGVYINKAYQLSSNNFYEI